MSIYINEQGLLNKEFFTPISNEDFNKQWYVITNNTSWCNVDEAVYSGPFANKEQALSHCCDSSCWPELMSAEEALAITY
jgi:hypothetical protein